LDFPFFRILDKLHNLSSLGVIISNMALTGAVASFPELFSLLENFRGGDWVFRGVPDPAFQLVPKIGRRPELAKAERRLYDMFRREAPSYMSIAPADEWELLAVGQHHGLLTRLLDWSENPLVASYFACDRFFDRDGILFALRAKRRYRETGTSPFAIDHVGRFRPRHTTDRIRVQRGLFTVQPDPTSALGLGKRDGVEVQAITVTKSYKEQLLWDLSRFGVHRSALFPDLDGLATHLNWMFTEYDPGKAPRRK